MNLMNPGAEIWFRHSTEGPWWPGKFQAWTVTTDSNVQTPGAIVWDDHNGTFHCVELSNINSLAVPPGKVGKRRGY